jgi:hypothetical protein
MTVELYRLRNWKYHHVEIREILAVDGPQRGPVYARTVIGSTDAWPVGSGGSVGG